MARTASVFIYCVDIGEHILTHWKWYKMWNVRNMTPGLLNVKGGMLLLITLGYSRYKEAFWDSWKIATCELIFLPCFFPQFFFTSFSARDRSYLSIFRLWQNVLLDKVSLSASVPVVKQPNNLFLMWTDVPLENKRLEVSFSLLT